MDLATIAAGKLGTGGEQAAANAAWHPDGIVKELDPEGGHPALMVVRKEELAGGSLPYDGTAYLGPPVAGGQWGEEGSERPLRLQHRGAVRRRRRARNPMPYHAAGCSCDSCSWARVLRENDSLIANGAGGSDCTMSARAVDPHGLSVPPGACLDPGGAPASNSRSNGRSPLTHPIRSEGCVAMDLFQRINFHITPNTVYQFERVPEPAPLAGVELAASLLPAGMARAMRREDYEAEAEEAEAAADEEEGEAGGVVSIEVSARLTPACRHRLPVLCHML